MLTMLTMSIPHQVDLKIEVDPNSAYRANNGAEINGFGRDGFGNFGEINLGGRAAHDFPVANATHPNSPLPPTPISSPNPDTPKPHRRSKPHLEPNPEQVANAPPGTRNEATLLFTLIDHDTGLPCTVAQRTVAPARRTPHAFPSERAPTYACSLAHSRDAGGQVL